VHHWAQVLRQRGPAKVPQQARTPGKERILVEQPGHDTARRRKLAAQLRFEDPDFVGDLRHGTRGQSLDVRANHLLSRQAVDGESRTPQEGYTGDKIAKIVVPLSHLRTRGGNSCDLVVDLRVKERDRRE